jgi:oligopeptide transport system ATP-binding protein
MPRKEPGEPILEVRDLRKYFALGRGVVNKAVDGVNMAIRQGETFGLVGESGCGKSTTGRTIIGLYPASGGQVIYRGKDTAKLNAGGLKAFTRQMQMIFQDPYASLDPRMTVADIIGEGIDIHGLKKNSERQNRIVELLEMVGLNSEHASRFPHEFSGGQRQRIGVARALAIEPEFIICDEPISALDVSIQAQVVNLLEDLQSRLGLTYIFIAHDLSMVRHISDRVGVMYLGTMVEQADSDELYKNPRHPYTQALLSAIPVPDPRVQRTRERVVLQGEVPSNINPRPGCRFFGRCPIAQKDCEMNMPPFKEIAPRHFAACHMIR